MHQKSADEFLAGQCEIFPLAAVFIVLYRKGNRSISHTLDPAIADRYPVRILAEIFDH